METTGRDPDPAVPIRFYPADRKAQERDPKLGRFPWDREGRA